MKEEKIKINVDGYDATAVVKVSGWLRKRRYAEYDLSEVPKESLRAAYSMLSREVNAKLKKKPFEFHLHIPL